MLNSSMSAIKIWVRDMTPTWSGQETFNGFDHQH